MRRDKRAHGWGFYVGRYVLAPLVLVLLVAAIVGCIIGLAMMISAGIQTLS